MAKKSLRMDPKSLMKFRRQLEILKKAALEGGAEGLAEHAQDVMDASQREVPVGTGTLKSAHYIEDPKIEKRDNRVSIKFGYGGPADKRHPSGQMVSDFMVYVHEDLKAHHPTGKAKFLEDPVMRAPQEMNPKIAVGVKGAFARVAIKR